MPTIDLADVVQQHREELRAAIINAGGPTSTAQYLAALAPADMILDAILDELDRLADAGATPGEKRHARDADGQAPTEQDRERISDYDQLADAIRDYFGDGGEQPWLVVHGDGETTRVRALSSALLPALSVRGLIQLGAAVVARGDNE